jgi:hypothetical protein
MGWLGDLWNKTSGADAVDLVLVQMLTTEGEEVEQIEANGCYVELYVDSLRLKRARKFATQFHGIVYSFVTLSREGEGNAELAAISKPEKLAALSKESLDKVITVSKRMMGAVPWRGGVLTIELGLFSVKAGNLLAPLVDFVAQVSSEAGVSFVGKVKPFLPLITKGMDLIAGQADNTVLEVAIDTTLKPTHTGAFAIIAAPKTELEGKKLTIDPVDRKLLLNGKPLERAFCVFSIRRRLQKEDFGEIPELKERYAALQSAIRSNDIKLAGDALTAFRLSVITSADLIPADANRLVEKATQRVKDAFPAGGISKLDRGGHKEKLSEIGLYS